MIQFSLINYLCFLQGLGTEALTDSGEVNPIDTVQGRQCVEHVFDGKKVYQWEWRVAHDTQIKIGTRLGVALGAGAKQNNLVSAKALSVGAHGFDNHRPDFLVPRILALGVDMGEVFNIDYGHMG